jgi:hypothetical protein
MIQNKQQGGSSRNHFNHIFTRQIIEKEVEGKEIGIVSDDPK